MSDRFTLKKDEKLCSRTAIDQLFSDGHSVIAYPLRAVYRCRESNGALCRMVIIIPKKKIRHAVSRVCLRRRTREAYRLHRQSHLFPALERATTGIDVAFIYLDKEPAPYPLIEAKMCVVLDRIAHQVLDHHAGTHE